MAKGSPDELEDDDALEFEITNTERKHLRNMLKAPGYLVLQKIWRAYTDAAVESAISASRVNPLGNANAIAHRWAYVAIAEEILINMRKGVDFEIELLTNAEQPAPDPVELAKRRRAYASFGALTPLPDR